MLLTSNIKVGLMTHMGLIKLAVSEPDIDDNEVMEEICIPGDVVTPSPDTTHHIDN